MFLGVLNSAVAKLDVESVGIRKVLNFHGLYPRSKNALCTVSESGNRITRRYLPSISSIFAQRRTCPSAWTHSRSGDATTRKIHSSWIFARSGRERIASKYFVTFTVQASVRP